MTVGACLLLITFFQMLVKIIPVLSFLHHKRGSQELVLSISSLIWIIQISVQFLFPVSDAVHVTLNLCFSGGLLVFWMLLFADDPAVVLFTSLSAWMFSAVLTALCGFVAASAEGYVPLGVEETAVLVFILFLVLYAVAVRLCAPATRQMFEILPLRTIRILCVYPLLSLIVFMVGFSGDTIRFETGGNALFNLLFMGMTLAVYFLLIKSLTDLVQRKEAELELEYARNVVVQQRNQYNQQLQNYESIQRLRHDFSLHMRALQGMETKEGVDAYLAKLADEYRLQAAEQFAEHRSVNAIVAWYAQQCRTQNIRLETHLAIPPDISIDALDLSVVVGNLLQNALEANKRLGELEDRYIRFDARMVEDQLMLMIENAFDGTVIKKNGEIISRKYKGGLGLVGIRRIVSRPGNDIEMSYTDTIFTVMVTLSA
ncbi:MAG: ATP-binding protein [Clostridia bacterium]|nr:ATP-binding protein [Clostridia bacterium]